MADVTYRANLKASSFPFLSELFGQSIIVKQQDQNYIAGLAAKESVDSAAGVPQVYYLHNVIPTDNGYRAVGYSEYTAPVFAAAVNMNRVVTLRDENGNSAQLGITAGGLLYVMEKGTNVWLSPGDAPPAGDIAGRRVTVAFVSGVTYIYFSKYACYTYDWTTQSLTLVVLGGLDNSEVVGVVGNKGYMLAYTESELAWSSVLDATDFVPSLETGAGGGQVEGARGKIVTAEEVLGGIIIFASENCIAAIASDNARYPYDFKPITGGGGLVDADYVSRDAGSGSVYAYTTSGMQQISLKSAASVFPEVTDFISGGLFESFNESLLELQLVETDSSLILKRIALVLDRYLIVSYGDAVLDHALYYDTAYKQWGRLKLEHTAVFDLSIQPTDTVETPKRSIAFLKATGAIDVLDTNIISANANGVMITGKYQYVRTRTLQLQGVTVENVEPTAEFKLYALITLDGKNFQPAVEGYLFNQVGKLREYKFHVSGVNHSLLWKGNFNSVSAVLNFNIAGSR